MTILLFDVDGTLTEPMKPITNVMLFMLNYLKQEGYILGIVGGSNIEKISAQIGPNIFTIFDYVFVENGLVVYKHGELIDSKSIIKLLGEANLQFIINTILKTLSEIVLPCKRGNFVELRNACINVSPIGRSCSYEEREQFLAYDNIHNIRKKLISNLETVLSEYNLEAAIGGMISIDIYPTGWNKSYCLHYLDEYDTIHFFGDKCEPQGNDYPLFIHPRINGHKISNPVHLLSVVNDLNL